MIKVNDSVAIDFRYSEVDVDAFKSGRPHVFRNRVTECELVGITFEPATDSKGNSVMKMVRTGDVIAKGSVSCHSGEPFVKREGRLKALEKATEGLDRNLRSQVFKAYSNRK